MERTKMISAEAQESARWEIKAREAEAEIKRLREALKIIERNTVTASFARSVAREALNE